MMGKKSLTSYLYYNVGECKQMSKRMKFFMSTRPVGIVRYHQIPPT